MDNVVEAVFPTLASLLSVYLRLSGGYIVNSDAPDFFLWLKIGPALGTAIVIGLVLLVAIPFGHISLGRSLSYNRSNKENKVTADEPCDTAVDGTESGDLQDWDGVDEQPQVHYQPHENHINHDKEEATKIHKPVSNGFVIVNPEFDDEHFEDLSASVQLSNLNTDDDEVTMTIAAETGNNKSDFEPITISKPRDMNESRNPFPVYFDEVPIENIPPPKPLRSATSYSTKTLPAPVAPTKNPWYISLERKNNVPKPPHRQNSSQHFEDELKQALVRVRTRSSITTNCRGPRVVRPSPSPATSSLNFEDELKKALSARRSSMNASYNKEPKVDLRLTKTAESVATSTSTSDEGTESDDQFSLNCDNGFTTDTYSVVSQPAPRPLQNSNPRQSLSESDLKVISDFSQTMERLKKKMRMEDAVKLESSISSIHKIVGSRSASENEREKNSGNEVEAGTKNSEPSVGINGKSAENVDNIMHDLDNAMGQISSWTDNK